MKITQEIELVVGELPETEALKLVLEASDGTVIPHIGYYDKKREYWFRDDERSITGEVVAWAPVPLFHGLPAEGQRVEHQTNVQKLIALHEALLQENPYSYFELARTRTTDWMAILATNVVDGHHDYRMLAKGQGMTPEEAAQSALQDYANRKA